MYDLLYRRCIGVTPPLKEGNNSPYSELCWFVSRNCLDSLQISVNKEFNQGYVSGECRNRTYITQFSVKFLPFVCMSNTIEDESSQGVTQNNFRYSPNFHRKVRGDCWS